MSKKIFLSLLPILFWTFGLSAQRTQLFKECIDSKLQKDKIYTSQEMDSLMFSCFVASISNTLPTIKKVDFDEDANLYRFLQLTNSASIAKCDLIKQIQDKGRRAFDKETALPTDRQLPELVFDSELSPELYDLTIMNSDTGGVSLKMSYKEPKNTPLNKYPLYYQNQLVGYTNDKAFRVDFQRPLPVYPIQGKLPNSLSGKALRQYLPIRLALDLQKEGLIYSLEFRILQEVVCQSQ